MLCRIPSPARSASSTACRASPTGGQVAPRGRHRERRLGKRGAVRQGMRFGDQRVGFRRRVRCGHDSRRAVDVHRHRRQIPRGTGPVAHRHRRHRPPSGTAAGRRRRRNGWRPRRRPAADRPARSVAVAASSAACSYRRCACACRPRRNSSPASSAANSAARARRVSSPADQASAASTSSTTRSNRAHQASSMSAVPAGGARRRPCRHHRSWPARICSSSPAWSSRSMPYWRIVSNARYLVGSPRSTTSRLCSARRANPSAISARSRPAPATARAASTSNHEANTATPAQQRAIVGREQVVAPADGVAQRAVAVGHAGAGGQEPQPLVEAGFQPVEAERREPGRGQLDGQCHAVQRPAQCGHAPGVQRRGVARRGGRPGRRTGRRRRRRRRRPTVPARRTPARTGGGAGSGSSPAR